MGGTKHDDILFERPKKEKKDEVVRPYRVGSLEAQTALQSGK